MTYFNKKKLLIIMFCINHKILLKIIKISLKIIKILLKNKKMNVFTEPVELYRNSFSLEILGIDIYNLY